MISKRDLLGEGFTLEGKDEYVDYERRNEGVDFRFTFIPPNVKGRKPGETVAYALKEIVNEETYGRGPHEERGFTLEQLKAMSIDRLMEWYAEPVAEGDAQ